MKCLFRSIAYILLHQLPLLLKYAQLNFEQVGDWIQTKIVLSHITFGILIRYSDVEAKNAVEYVSLGFRKEVSLETYMWKL